MAVKTNAVKENENNAGLFVKTKGMFINVMRREGRSHPSRS